MAKKKTVAQSKGGVVRVSRALGHTFQDKDLLLSALTHRSLQKGGGDYERLEFLGDAVLELASSLALYHRFPEMAEGELTRLRAALVQGENLARVGLELGLEKALRVSADAARNGTHRNAGVLADVVEACFGAVFLDGGLAAAEKVFSRLFAARIDGFAEAVPALHTMNPKGAAQELLQAQRRSHEYRTLETSGPSHRKHFQTGLYVDGELAAVGEGSSIKRAETAAARRFLEDWTDE